MRYADLSSLEYDEQLFQELNSFGRGELRRFFNLYHEQVDERKLASDANFSKDGLRKILATDFQAKTETLLGQYRQLRDEAIRLGDATQYLSEVTSISGEQLNIGSLTELLILLYEEGYVTQLDELIAGIDLRSNHLKRSYYLNANFDPGGISNDAEAFFEQWHHSQTSLVPVRIDIEAEFDRSVLLHLYREKRSGAKTYPVFAFREDENSEADEIPTNPKVKRMRLRTLDELRVGLQLNEDTTIITLNASISGWKNILNVLFDVTLDIKNGVAKMEPYRTTKAEAIEDNLEESIDEQLSPEDTPLDTARKILDNRRSEALKEVDALDLPRHRREELKEHIQTIKIGGSDIQNDPSIATQEFRLVGDLPQLFSSVDIEDGYRDLLNKSSPDSRGLVIQVNGKGMRLKDGQWKKLDAGGLAISERQAIEHVFEETRS